MDIDILMIVVFAVGVLTLFFFPEPESNFFAYAGTALLFVIVMGILFWVKKKS
ncbi:hypothetical protein K8R30_02275 [archaeon]|nr:hypothetical protein [archaeon]